MSTVATALFYVSILLISIGGFLYRPAVTHLRPEFKRAPGFGLYWFPQRFTPEGQQLLRRAWRVQLLGVALLLIAVLLPR